VQQDGHVGERSVIAPIYLRILVAAEPVSQRTADVAATAALASTRAGALVRL
jgi:hypothetical protein